MTYVDHSIYPVQKTLAEARMAQGLKVRALAESIIGHPSVAQLTHWETGSGTPPSLKALTRWAAALGFEIVAVPRSAPSSPGLGADAVSPPPD
ncbi:MAG: helix-turn-helix transcriptional regulator [Chloroflexota bacterium]